MLRTVDIDWTDPARRQWLAASCPWSLVRGPLFASRVSAASSTSGVADGARLGRMASEFRSIRPVGLGALTGCDRPGLAAGPRRSDLVGRQSSPRPRLRSPALDVQFRHRGEVCVGGYDGTVPKAKGDRVQMQSAAALVSRRYRLMGIRPRSAYRAPRTRPSRMLSELLGRLATLLLPGR